jgi:DNA (cytosine-5)-methyltransferase 1
MSLRVADFCCGIGTLSLGFRQAGYRPVFACEIDPAAAETYATNLGVVPAGDLAGVDPDAVPDHEACVAGLPCQAFSTAGRRGRFDDPREAVLWSFLRVLTRKKPGVVVVENVPALAREDGGRGLRFLAGCLRTAGYRVAWQVLDAARFGGAQHRPRLFVVGARGRRFDFDRLHARPAGRVADLLDADPGGWLEPGRYTLVPPKVLPGGQVFVGYRHAPRLRVPGGNQQLVETHLHVNRVYSAAGVWPTLTASGPSRLFWAEVGGRVRRLTRPELQRLQGLPGDFAWPHPGQFSRLLGNSVHVPTARTLAAALREQLFGVPTTSHLKGAVS